MNTDPIADMLTRIRNAGAAKKSRVDIPQSKVKTKIAAILKEAGYVADYREIAGKAGQPGLIELKLRYDENNEPVIMNVKRVSRPGLRQYLGYREIPKVRNGLGIMILTTSKGLMTDGQARKAQIGGEALCTLW